MVILLTLQLMVKRSFSGDTEPYDAVILDLGLPKIDGITVLEKWRKDKKISQY